MAMFELKLVFEYEHISMGGTLKVLMNTKGQLYCQRSKEDKQSQALPEVDTKSKTLVVVRTIGVCFAMALT